MRCSLVNIRDTYSDRQGRSDDGRAAEEYMVWMHARNVFGCLQRIAMTLTRMHATDTSLAVATP
jgi:hypothetical protein